MIHEIAPFALDNQFRARLAEPGDTVLVFRGEEMLSLSGDSLVFPRLEQLQGVTPDQLVYLFAISQMPFFMLSAGEDFLPPPDYAFVPASDMRQAQPQHLAYAGILGHQLYRWYMARRFCGACGQKNAQDTMERMLYCPGCGHREYPAIMPAVIVGVIHGDSLLLTKYAGRVNPRWALVAGFTEAGETPEETVRREVLEETGLHVTAITYYKSQPWPFSGSLLMGYFAQVEGPSELTLETRELAEAEFMPRDMIDVPFEGLSLTNEMICCFRDLGPVPLLAQDPLRQAPYFPGI